MSDELRPCPFCNSRNVSLSIGSVDEGYRRFAYVECDDCSAAGPPSKSFREEESGSAQIEATREAWNTREYTT